jgi:hypothetical protein
MRSGLSIRCSSTRGSFRPTRELTGVLSGALAPPRTLFPPLAKRRAAERRLTRGGVRLYRLGVGFVSSAQASALAKVGKTSVLAGIKLEVMTPSGEAPNAGVVQVRADSILDRIVFVRYRCVAEALGGRQVSFEMPPVCSPSLRPGRPSEEAQSVEVRLQQALDASKAYDLEQLCIQEVPPHVVCTIT